MADANLRYAADGTHFAPVLRHCDFRRADVYVCAFCASQHPDKEEDIPWLLNIVEVLKGNEHKVADVGKYNAGQKMMFWSIMSMIFVLLVTGVIIWRPYFAQYFPMQVVRYSLLITRLRVSS